MPNEKFPCFYPTNLFKFSFLSIVSFGIYELYWFYKTWKYVQKYDDKNIRPFWRAFFAPIWTYSVSKKIFSDKKEFISIFIFILYLLLNVIWKLPDPYWLISLCSFVPLLPLVYHVNKLNKDRLTETYSRFGWKHVLVSLIGSPLLLVVISSTLNIIPSTQVVLGNSISNDKREFIYDICELSENEEILYFYSGAMFSIKEDGNFFTQNNVVSYWESEEGDGFYVEKAEYADITDVRVAYSKNLLEDTVVSIIRLDGSEFQLIVSSEEGKDKIFIKKLKSIWNAQQGHTR